MGDQGSFVFRAKYPLSVEDLFAWHERPGVFERLMPAWEKVKVLDRNPGIEVGNKTTLQFPLGLAKLNWTVGHTEYEANKRFVDEQVKGPFSFYRHEHVFEALDANSCEITDTIHYALPGGSFSHFFLDRYVQKRFAQVFAYRRHVLTHDLLLYKRYSDKKLKVLVSGATGMVGSALIPLLESMGHTVFRLVRGRVEGDRDILWDPDQEKLPLEMCEGADVFVHLAGDNIASARWSEEKKQKIFDSRVKVTQFLVRKLNELQEAPKVLLSASAVGYYGDRGDELLSEESKVGNDFLAKVCSRWESACEDYTKGRVACLRFGAILSPVGGALQKMLLPFKMGAGGILGHGKQYFPWVALPDVLDSIYHTMMTESVTGPVNVVAPHQITNYQYTKALGSVLGRPTIFPMPAKVARLAFGEMAEALLLASQRVEAKKLVQTGMVFRYQSIESALRHLLGKASL